jgi:hypothetical protein
VNLSLWAVLLAALGGVLLSLGALVDNPRYPRYPRVLSAFALALFAASAVLTLVVAGDG